MPQITRLFVKTSFVSFVVALLAGLALVARPLLDLPPAFAALGPVYFHLLMVGWVTQLIIGIAYWMFPKFTREQPRGHDWLAWTTYGFLNVGLLLRVIAEPAQTIQPAPIWSWLIAASAILQWLAGLVFVANTWPRVKEK